MMRLGHLVRTPHILPVGGSRDHPRHARGETVAQLAWEYIGTPPPPPQKSWKKWLGEREVRASLLKLLLCG